MDNFERADRYTHRFALRYVDDASPKQTPSLSARRYNEVIARNAVA